MNCREMLQLVDVLASEKNVAKDTVFGVLEAALEPLEGAQRCNLCSL